MDMGFTGWAYAPPFSKRAKDLLCEDPAKFFANYGDHYVYGTRNGANIRIETTVTTHSVELSHTTSA